MWIKIWNTDISKIKIASGLTPRLPSVYQEVEYIESSWTQYIDTWMAFTNNTTVSLDINITTAPSWWTGVIWAQKNNIDTSWAIWVNTNAGTYQHWTAFGDWNSGPLLNQRVIYSNDATHLYINWASVKTISNWWTFTTPVNWTIFKVNYQNSTWFQYLVKAKLYNCKVYESWTLVRDFVPCYRKNDTEIWLYDLVNDVFYTNQWSWIFTKWADVNLPYKEIKKVYLGSTQVRPSGWWWWQPWANTLAYRPLSSDLNDYSWNNHHFSATSWTYSFSDNMCTLQRATISWWSLNWLSNDFTVNMWTSWFWANSAFMFSVDNGWYPSWQLYWGWPWTEVGFNMIYNNNFYWAYKPSYWGVWVHLFTWIKTATTITLYIDGVQQDQTTGTFWTFTWHNNTWLWRNVFWSWTGTCWEIIIEDKARTAQEILDYYNQTKSNYWL